MDINTSKLFVNPGAFHTLRIQSVAHALNNAYLHAHYSILYCYSQHLSSSKERKFISKTQESSEAFYLNQRPLPRIHAKEYIKCIIYYIHCFSLKGCNRYRSLNVDISNMLSKFTMNYFFNEEYIFFNCISLELLHVDSILDILDAHVI